MPRRPALVFAGLALAAGPVLAACGGGTDPVTVPAPTVPASERPTPTPTATPSVPAPVRPANADDNSADGMKAFTQYAIDTINYAYATGDANPLAAISAPSCPNCEKLAADLRGTWAKGGRTMGSQITVIRLGTPGPAEGVRPSVVVDYNQSAFEELNSAGAVVESSPPKVNQQFVVDLFREGDSWLLDGVRQGEA